MSAFVEVAVPVGVRRTFTYSVPAALRPRISPGVRIVVPFGPRLLTAFAVRLLAEPPQAGLKLRAVREVLDDGPLVPPALVDTALWIADYYFTPAGEVFRALFPAGTQVSASRTLRLASRAARLLEGGLRPPGVSPAGNAILSVLAERGPLSSESLGRATGRSDTAAVVAELAASGWVEVETRLERGRVGEKEQLGIEIAAGSAAGRITALQGKVLSNLEARGGPVPLQPVLEACGASLAVARALEKKGLVSIAPIRIRRTPLDLAESLARKDVVLTSGQAAVLEELRAALRSGEARRCLLHGVTGSGKTEIYLRLIADVLRQGETALLLVPEIGLTPLLSRIAVSHFPDQVALLHSGMGPGERLDEWDRVRQGGAHLVVGTRSAVFAPVPGPRLIVIDEEQDPSYKQDEPPQYHAREVAWHRAQQCGGLLVLGSATPSLETYYAATVAREARCLELPERIESRPLPAVSVVDMAQEFQRHGRNVILSEELQSGLRDRLERGEQSIVLLNRRGYSRTLLCRSCGYAVTCSQCSVRMTFHRADDRLMCHYCGLELPVPSSCGECGGKYIYFVGAGTEQVEQTVRSVLPGARVARLDRDTTRKRGALRKILLDFLEHRLDVLVGTQMVAKGHDFPRVTLVGVIGADAGLALPDFRAAERTFQLLTQVAGRAGRGEVPGLVIIQSYHPAHYALRYAREQDYPGFFRHEIEFRKLLAYPPASHLVQILTADAENSRALDKAQRIAGALRAEAAASGGAVRILGPAAAPLEKLRGLYRVQILLKSSDRSVTGAVLRRAFERLSEQKVVLKQVSVDVDPLSLL